MDRLTFNLRGVDFWDAQNGWAVGKGSLIAHTSNGGANWAVQSPPADVTRNLAGVVAVQRRGGVGSG